MARPVKIGLDYFPLDVDFFEDEKLLAISGEFSVKGEIIVLRLLCEIYRNGYFVEYSELLKNKLARLGGLSGGLVDEVVKKLVKYNFFDEVLFRECKILTSKAIQRRFSEAIKRRKNDSNFDYWLLEIVNVSRNHSLSVVNVNINTQSKVKESKVNNNIESGADAPTPTKSFKQFSKTDFTNEIQAHLKEFGKELCNQFFSYWTEKSASGKMKFQLEKTWDTKKRLDTWQRNEDRFGSKQQKEAPINRIKEKEL